MRSEARTVDEYLAELPEKRREVVSALRDLMVKHLPEGFDERMKNERGRPLKATGPGGSAK